MENIRLSKITVSPFSSPLVIHNGNVHIYDTTSSTSRLSGSFVTNGGISINCTHDAQSSTEGGTLTVGGGASISKTLFVGKDLIVEDWNGVFSVGGISENRLFLDTTLNKQFYISLDGVNRIFEIREEHLKFEATSPSSASTVGSLIVAGGLGIGTTSNAESFTNGGGLTVAGGIAVARDAYVGSDLKVGSGLTVGTSLNVTNSITAVSMYASTGITGGNGLFTNLSVGSVTSESLLVTNGKATRVSTSTLIVSSTMTSANAFITNNLATNITCSNLLTLNANVNNITTANLRTVLGITTASLHATDTFTTNLTATSANIVSGSFATMTASSLVSSNVSTGNLHVSDITSTNITSTSMRATSLDASTLICDTFLSNFEATMGKMYVGESITALSNSNTLGTLYTTGGNVGIGNVAPVASLDVDGTFQVSNNVQFTGNVSSTNSSTSTFVLTRGGLSINNSSNSQSSTQGGAITVNGGCAIAKDLHVGGQIHLTNALMVSGGVFFLGSSNASSATDGGSLTVSGGAGISKDVYIGGALTCNSTASFKNIFVLSTQASTSSSIASLVCEGGLSVGGTESSLSVTQGGGVTIAGGCSVAKDLYVGGQQYAYNATNYYGSNIINIHDSSNAVAFSVHTNDNSELVIRRHNDTTIQNVMAVSQTTGSVVFSSTIPSSSIDSASIVVSGGMSLNYTEAAISLNNGGGLSNAGGASISKNLLVGGDTHIFSTTESDSVSTGALVVDGGVGIGGNMSVLGNAVFQGDLTVNGTTLVVNSSNTTIFDNILHLNAGPSGSRDAGFLIQRFQVDNDSGTGDIVNDTRFISNIIGTQSGLTDTQVALGAGAVLIDDYYNGWWIKIGSGFASNQVRQIVDYDSSSQIATLSTAWSLQNPGSGDTVYLYNKSFVGMVYDEVQDEFVVGSTVNDPGATNVSFTDVIPIRAYSMTLTATTPSSSTSVGSLSMEGGLSINNTSEATSASNGGSITTKGGIGVGKSMYIGENVFINGNTLQIPRGDTLSKPSDPEPGYVYFNLDTADIEAYTGSVWTSLISGGKVSDLDGDTRVQTESTIGADDDTLVFFTNDNEIMRMTSTGNVGIGTTDPSTLLHVDGSVLLSSTAESIGVGTGGTLTVLGGASFSKDVYVGGAVTSSSDIRLKENITAFKCGDNKKVLDKIESLRTIKFNYKHDPEEKKQIGFIAQDFQEYFPELLRKPNENGYYTLDYAKITVILLECIKELKEDMRKMKFKLIESLFDDTMFDTSS